MAEYEKAIFLHGMEFLQVPPPPHGFSKQLLKVILRPFIRIQTTGIYSLEKYYSADNSKPSRPTPDLAKLLNAL